MLRYSSQPPPPSNEVKRETVSPPAPIEQITSATSSNVKQERKSSEPVEPPLRLSFYIPFLAYYLVLMHIFSFNSDVHLEGKV